MEHESEVDTICDWHARYSHQRLGKGTGRLSNKRTCGDHPNHSIFEIESWRIEETCCHSDDNEKLSANPGVKNSQKRK